MEINNHIQDIVKNGFTIVKNYLTTSEVLNIKTNLNQLYVEQLTNKEFFDKGVPLGLQSVIAKDRMINNLVAYGKQFIDLATVGDHLKIIKFFLNDPYYGLIPENDCNFILAQMNARAGIVPLPYHVDTRMVTPGFQTWSIQGFLAIEGLNHLNGGLIVIPGTHSSGTFPTKDSIDYGKAVTLNLEAGDLVLFSSQLHHATAAVADENLIGWSVLLTYRSWWCKQQFSLYSLVGSKEWANLTDNQKLLLGAASITPSEINASASARCGYENMWANESDRNK